MPSDAGSTLAAAEYLIPHSFADLQPFNDGEAVLEGLDTNNLESTEPQPPPPPPKQLPSPDQRPHFQHESSLQPLANGDLLCQWG
jgi:hypothetical protein